MRMVIIAFSICAALFAVLTLLVYAFLFRPTVVRRKKRAFMWCFVPDGKVRRCWIL